MVTVNSELMVRGQRRRHDRERLVAGNAQLTDVVGARARCQLGLALCGILTGTGDGYGG